jgi:hypothetical protein
MPIGEWFSNFNATASAPENRDKLMLFAALADKLGQGITKGDPTANPAGGIATGMIQGAAQEKANVAKARPDAAKVIEGTKAYTGLLNQAGKYAEASGDISPLTQALLQRPGFAAGKMFQEEPVLENPTVGPGTFSEPQIQARQISDALAMALGPEGVNNAWNIGQGERKLDQVGRQLDLQAEELPGINATRTEQVAASQFERSQAGHQMAIERAQAAVKAQIEGEKSRDQAKLDAANAEFSLLDKVQIPDEFASALGVPKGTGYGFVARLYGDRFGPMVSDVRQIQAGREARFAAASAAGEQQKFMKAYGLFESVNEAIQKYVPPITVEQWGALDQLTRAGYAGRGIRPVSSEEAKASLNSLRALEFQRDALGESVYGPSWKEFSTKLKGTKVSEENVVDEDALRKTLRGSKVDTGTSQWFQQLFGGGSPKKTSGVTGGF